MNKDYHQLAALKSGSEYQTLNGLYKTDWQANSCAHPGTHRKLLINSALMARGIEALANSGEGNNGLEEIIIIIINLFG